MRRSLRLTALFVSTLALAGCARMVTINEILRRNRHAFVEPIKPAPFTPKQVLKPDARLAVLWVGHATVLIQLDDRVVLTDPVFTDTVGQLSKRMIAPAISVERLPAIDAVVISHMHFDHLSLGSLDQIERKTRVIYLPEGAAVYVPRSQSPTIELPSYQSYEIDGLRVTAVPVEHNGWRYSGDREWMTKSFTGYVIEYRGLSVYFGGDTAYTPAFRDTRARFPQLDLAILPIAPLHPRDFICRTHLGPAQALDAFRDLGARVMLPMHFDTFVNSLDEVGEAPRSLRGLMPSYGLDETRVAILQQGEQRTLIRRSEKPLPARMQ